MAHQNFYEGDFEVVLMQRSGFYDFFPYSLFYGISDIGSWGGLISTDGKKMVVTKSKYTDLAKVKKTFEVEVTDISEVKFNSLKAYFTFNKKIPGLTMPALPMLIKLCTLGFSIFLYPLLSKKSLQVRIDDQFKNVEAFSDLLKQ
jgi:hypothetical protein